MSVYVTVVHSSTLLNTPKHTHGLIKAKTIIISLKVAVGYFAFLLEIFQDPVSVPKSVFQDSCYFSVPPWRRLA